MPTTPRRNTTQFSTLITLLCLLFSSSLAAATEVVTSIKPLSLLVRAVAGDSVEITTLVPPGSSPHTYTMRPSQRRALERADAIFWVGPELESFLTRLLAGEDFKGRVTALAPNAGEEDRHRDGDDKDEHDHGHHDDHGHEQHGEHADDHHEAHGGEHDEAHDGGHNHGDGKDPHLWLDPALALDMAEAIRDTLANLEGMDPEQLTRNFERFKIKLQATETSIRAQLSGAEDIGLFSYHDAFSRFADHFDLTLEGILTLNPALSPGARHIQEVQAQLRETDNACIMTEPQFNQQWWTSITEGLDVRFSTWDPLASDIEDNADGYLNFLLGIADSVTYCLPE